MGIIQKIEGFMGQAPDQPVQQQPVVMVTEEVPAVPVAPIPPVSQPPQPPVIGDTTQVEARENVVVPTPEPTLIKNSSEFNCPDCKGEGLKLLPDGTYSQNELCLTCKGTGKV